MEASRPSTPVLPTALLIDRANVEEGITCSTLEGKERQGSWLNGIHGLKYFRGLSQSELVLHFMWSNEHALNDFVLVCLPWAPWDDRGYYDIWNLFLDLELNDTHH
jgi:hypothetical protein